MNDLEPPIQVVTEMIREEITTEESPLKTSANETRYMKIYVGFQ